VTSVWLAGDVVLITYVLIAIERVDCTVSALLGGILLGFLIHGALHLELATIAPTGATLLLLWTRSDPHHVLQKVGIEDPLFLLGSIHHRGGRGAG
jgi:Na+/H+ antiporter NhaD/arsenite permease-like protein